MHTEKREDPSADHNYEVRDINAPAIWKSTLYFFGFALISVILGAIVFVTMNPGLKTNNEKAGASKRRDLAKNVPLLQSNTEAKTDMMLMRQREEAKMHGAPAQNEDGTFSIPVEAAMKMVVETGAKQTESTAVAPVGSPLGTANVRTPDAEIGGKASAAPKAPIISNGTPAYTPPNPPQQVPAAGGQPSQH